jgi:hypothetical protein
MTGLSWTDIPEPELTLLRRGTVIPAHPLALDEERHFDRDSQKALTRYYIDAGSGGLAVGVHATQFQIREAQLYRPVLELAAETANVWGEQPLFMVAGAIGKTAQAVTEAQTARALGYHAVLLGLGAMKGASEDELIAHCEAVAAEMPLIGFYLQTAVGGIPLSRSFWARFAAIENVIAIKVAPFNRYRTLDVAFGVVAARAEERVTLYTGNDDHILLDLVTPYRVWRGNDAVTARIVGGLLGHWSVWVQKAVELLARAHAIVAAGRLDPDFLALDGRVTDMNQAIFDPQHDFHGCIAGCHEVLRRQGILETTLCLDPKEGLSPGQAEEIDRVIRENPDLVDDAFVAESRERWLN